MAALLVGGLGFGLAMYKVMVVSAGFLGIGFLPLVLASIIGRTARFMLIAGIVRHRRDNKIAGLLTVLLVVLVLVFWSIAT